MALPNLDFLADRSPGFLELTFGTSIALALRYLMFAGMGWLLGYVFFQRRWFHRKIIARLPESADVRRELAYSVLTVVIFGVVAAVTVLASKAGLTQMYWRIGDHGVKWFWASIVCAILLHDTYFYWTHRLMHHPGLFRWFHRVHHLSSNPSPWASYAFAPMEAVVQAGIFPLAVLIMPMHPVAFALFMLWQIVFNVLGHTGYEFHPPKLMETPFKRILNTPTNHVMHHEKMAGNYGLYFNIWDRLMGTNHKDYEDRFRQVTSQQPAHLPSAGRTATTAS
jgi:sterol desaturase/sphingolipid hydroxylase (fatty acid hydroxylase superfamily)